VNGMAFMAGAAVVGSLWGWATPRWGCCGGYGYGGRYGYGSVNINVNHYNNISRNTINRAPLSGNTWRPASPGVAGRPLRPPGGPVIRSASIIARPASRARRRALRTKRSQSAPLAPAAARAAPDKDSSARSTPRCSRRMLAS
jgi:hypothetical protein